MQPLLYSVKTRPDLSCIPVVSPISADPVQGADGDELFSSCRQADL